MKGMDTREISDCFKNCIYILNKDGLQNHYAYYTFIM